MFVASSAVATKRHCNSAGNFCKWSQFIQFTCWNTVSLSCAFCLIMLFAELHWLNAVRQSPDECHQHCLSQELRPVDACFDDAQLIALDVFKTALLCMPAYLPLCVNCSIPQLQATATSSSLDCCADRHESAADDALHLYLDRR